MKNKTRMDFETPTANLWRRRYLLGLKSEIRLLLPSDTAAVMSSVSEQAQILFDKHVHKAPDKQGMLTIGCPSLIIASHRELAARGISESVSFEVLRRAFRSTLQTEITWVMRLQTFLVRDPWTFFEKNFIPILNWEFGKSFTWEKKQTETGWALVGKQCGFWDLFCAEGEPRLTKLLCEWDRNWMNPLDKSKRGIATRRTMTLSTGSSHCEFHFDRAPAAPSKTVDIVLQTSR